MTTHGKAKIQHLNELVNEKETEWRSLLQTRLDSLTKGLAERDEELRLERLRFTKLKTDFEYNLNLLSERDRELDEYETVFERLKANDLLKNSEVSEMKIKVDESVKRCGYALKEKEELQRYYQSRLKSYQDEVNDFYFKKDDEVQQEKLALENVKKQLQKTEREVHENAAFTQQQLLQEFSERFKEKEKEFQDALEEKETELHASLLKIKMVSKEMELLRSSTRKVEDTMEDNKSKTVQMQRLLKQKDWELEDLSSIKNLEFKELQGKLKEVLTQKERMEKDYSVRSCEMEKLLNERQQNILSLKQATDEIEEKLQDKIDELNKKNEDLASTLRKTAWDASDKLKEKNVQIKKLQEQLSDVEASLKNESESNNKDKVSKDLQLQSLMTSQSQLKIEKEQLRQETSRLKKDLNSAIERERIVESAKVQIEMDWRRRLESRESEIYQQHDQLIKNLTQAKEETLECLKAKGDELAQQECLLKMLQGDWNIALKLLQKHDVDINALFSGQNPAVLKEQGHEATNDIDEQNKQLKDVIKQMREDMEMLSQQKLNLDEKQVNQKSAYTTDLENEVRDLKSTNRELNSRIEELSKEMKPPTGMQLDVQTHNSSQVKIHLKELNETIGFLRNEKVQLMALLTSKDAKICHARKCLGECEQEKERLRLQLENVKYEIKASTDNDHSTVTSLRERISQLELQLEEEHSKVRVYQKSVLQQNLDATFYGKQISEMKIRQPDERHGIISIHAPDKDELKAKDQTKRYEKLESLRTKLRLAIERIKELMLEREQLINTGNRLRAELSHESRLKESGTKYHENDVDHLQEKLNSKKKMNAVQQLRGEENSLQYFTTSTENVETPSLLRTSSEHSDIKEVWKLLEQDDISLESSNILQMKLREGSEVTKDDEHQYRAVVNDQFEVIGQSYPGKLLHKGSNKVEQLLKPQQEKQQQQRKSQKNNQRKVRNYNEKK